MMSVMASRKSERIHFIKDETLVSEHCYNDAVIIAWFAFPIISRAGLVKDREHSSSAILP